MEGEMSMYQLPAVFLLILFFHIKHQEVSPTTHHARSVYVTPLVNVVATYGSLDTILNST